MKKKDTTETESKTISAERFDELTDSGSDGIDRYLDWENPTRPGLEIKRISINVPQHFLTKLDKEAAGSLDDS